MIKNLPAMRRPWFDPWARKIPWKNEWLPTPLLLPGESQGQRSQAGDSSCGHKESETTERLSLSQYKYLKIPVMYIVDSLLGSLDSLQNT